MPRRALIAAALLVAAQLSASAESWERENLELPRANSKVLEIEAANLTSTNLIARSDTAPTLVVWFYAPWCKQCKLVRDAFETLAATGVDGIEFGRLDCTQHKLAKEAYGVTSYPAFKVVRGARHGWLAGVPKTRTAEQLRAAVVAAARPFEVATTADELKTLVFEQSASLIARTGVAEADDWMLHAGVGEAAVIANLEVPAGGLVGGPAAFANLAAGWSLRHSPLPFIAVKDASLLAAAGLPALPPDGVALVQLLADDADALADGAAAASGPRVVTASLAEPEEKLAQLLLAHRLPTVIDFLGAIAWPKRAATLSHAMAHALLFVPTAAAAAPAAALRAAVERFERGRIYVFLFKLDADFFDPAARKPTALTSRYGVASLLDTPRLVFLDQRSESENRQVVYKGELEEEALAGWLEATFAPPRAGTKDEL